MLKFVPFSFKMLVWNLESQFAATVLSCYGSLIDKLVVLEGVESNISSGQLDMLSFLW